MNGPTTQSTRTAISKLEALGKETRNFERWLGRLQRATEKGVSEEDAQQILINLQIAEYDWIIAKDEASHSLSAPGFDIWR